MTHTLCNCTVDIGGKLHEADWLVFDGKRDISYSACDSRWRGVYSSAYLKGTLHNYTAIEIIDVTKL